MDHNKDLLNLYATWLPMHGLQIVIWKQIKYKEHKTKQNKNQRWHRKKNPDENKEKEQNLPPNFMRRSQDLVLSASKDHGTQRDHRLPISVMLWFLNHIPGPRQHTKLSHNQTNHIKA